MEGSWQQNERVVEISSPQTNTGRFAPVLSILIFLLVFVNLAFGIGYFVGKSQSNTQTPVSNDKANTTSEGGKTTFSDPKENYSLVFPDSWKATEKLTSSPGVLLETKGGSVELWLKIDQPFSLAKEQKESIVTTNKVKIKVNDKEIEMTEHVYNTGSFFTVVILPATTKTSLATFWIKAQDKETYTAAKEIVGSFKFK